MLHEKPVFSEVKLNFLKKKAVKNLPPRKPKNKDRRSREYLTEKEVNTLLKTAKLQGKDPKLQHRDYTLILLLYRHGLRVSEATELKWTQIDFDSQILNVIRKKNGKRSTHPLDPKEMAALRKLKKMFPFAQNVFCNVQTQKEIGTRNVRRVLSLLGEAANLPISIHPHMLRHACGFYLANKDVNIRVIQDYLGHKDINHTVRYTDLAPRRFNNLWEK